MENSMAGFICHSNNNCLHWICNPNTVSAHQDLLAALSKIIDRTFLQPQTPIGNRRKGNLGEFVAFHVGLMCNGLPAYKPFPTNAYQPLSDISRAGIDIV